MSKENGKPGVPGKDTLEDSTEEAAESVIKEDEPPVLPGLIKGLQSVFDKIHKDNRDRDSTQERAIEDLTTSLNQAFEKVHVEAREREKLLEEKIAAIEKEQSYRIQRIKLFSLPGMVIASFADLSLLCGARYGKVYDQHVE